MFEKDAEIYADKNKIDVVVPPYGNISNYYELKKGFKDGAEFGYNKAKEEMQKNGLALQSDMDKTIEQNIQLKKLIEKFEKLVPKTCENCVGYGCHAICVDCDFKDKWEIK